MPRRPDRRSLNPLITPAAEALLLRLLEHPDAPRWNYRTGDWIDAGDLEALQRFREDVLAPRPVWTGAAPPPRLVQALAEAIPRVEWLRSRIPTHLDVAAGCFLVCAQHHTITYATVHAVWNNSGYAKINLNPADWPASGAASRFVAAFDPPVLCGDPIAFAEMVEMGIEAHPRAMLSTAVALSPCVRRRIEQAYRCPVIDTYSLNETGLVAYACREGDFHVLPPDLYVEVLDADGRVASDGQRGEIAVTVFRNPYLPLLRCRTGDHARLERGPCACGDPAPRLLAFEGRPPVLFRAADGSVVNAVDLSQAFRRFPLRQHRIVQRADGACEAWIRPMGGDPAVAGADVADALRQLLGDVRISIRLAPDLGTAAGGKVVAYASEWSLCGEA